MLWGHMLTAMNTVNEAKPDPPRSSCDITDWTSVVRQLAKQAKRRSKPFYRRVKHTLLSPAAQSTLRVPSRKIQRILQRNNPWSTEDDQHITQYPQLDNLPPPTYDALRTLARAARKKSPGPDDIPPYLLSILPATTFATVHACVSLCYQTGDIPLPWLVSENLCLYKGKGSWQDPDRWRPIAMSNSIYRLLMRWVYRMHTAGPAQSRQEYPKIRQIFGHNLSWRTPPPYFGAVGTKSIGNLIAKNPFLAIL